MRTKLRTFEATKHIHDMSTLPEIERSFYEDKLYEYAYLAAVNYFYHGDEEALWNSDIGFRLFYKIQVGEIVFPFSKEQYEENTDIQNSLALKGLDPEKFWQAMLYIHAMAKLRKNNAVPVIPTVQERIQDIIDALSDPNSSVRIDRPGKKPLTIDDEMTKEFLSRFLKDEDEQYSILNDPSYTGGTWSMDKAEVGARWQIYDVYYAYDKIFDNFCTDMGLPKRVANQKGSRDKVLLVSRILYFTGVVKDGKYLYSKDPLKSVLNHCSESPRPKLSYEPRG